jgi:hypothetical protein
VRLGMQIMIEGLALGAFSMMYHSTREPLLKELLRYVIQDEARHVHYGVLALKRHFAELSDRELREREDWTFEVACLMRDRFARGVRRVVRRPDEAQYWDKVMSPAILTQARSCSCSWCRISSTSYLLSRTRIMICWPDAIRRRAMPPN